MIYKVGKYIKIQDSYWSEVDKNFIIIHKVNKKEKVIHYTYENDCVSNRVRYFFEFDQLILIPSSSLFEELL